MYILNHETGLLEHFKACSNVLTFCKIMIKGAKDYLIQHLSWFCEIGIPQERCQKFEQINQQLGIHSPSLKEITKSH